MQKITPFLWFNNQAEEAVNLYTSVFKNSKIVNVARYGEAGANVSGMPKGTVMSAMIQMIKIDIEGLKKAYDER